MLEHAMYGKGYDGGKLAGEILLHGRPLVPVTIG